MGRVTPEIPSASLADIAFMLLIFFLVATTMDVDSGISRILPPMPEEEPDDDQQIRERNIFTVRVNAQDMLLVEGELENLVNLRDRAKEFIANPRDEEHLPEKVVEEVEYFGEYPISRQVISLQNARGTSYGMYIKVQNELTAAYNELRDELAMDRFGRIFERLDASQQAAVRKIYPMRISEAEPRQVGGR
ncbi:MAG: biopolymer transporter ExbD [Marinilabiliales bacterium]|nr:MAG: biopolymer transporter ExbD [Marinilabiliales bacterium]